MKNIINRYVAFVVKRYKLVVLLAFMVLIGAGMLSTKMSVDNSMEGMLPDDNEVIYAMNEMQEEFGNQESVIVVVKGESGNDQIRNYVEDLAVKITQAGIAKNLTYKYELGEEIEYIASESGNLYLMTVIPDVNFDNVVDERDEFFETLLGSINELLARPDYSELNAGITGGMFVQDYEGEQNLTEGFLLTAILALVIIIAIFIISFKRLFLPFTTALPLVLGVVVTAAIAALMFDGLTTFSLSFAVFLLGMGIDYAIHILSRYSEQRTLGETLEKALVTTIEKTGLSMFIGSLTAAVAFLAFIFADMKAFTQMGIIASVGIFLAMLCQLLVTPALIAWADRKRQHNESKNMEFGFMRPVGKFTSKSGKVVMGIAAVFMALTFYNVMNASVDRDMSSFYPTDLPSYEWLEIVQEEFDYNPDEMTIMASNLDELALFSDRLKSMDTIATVDSVLNFLPEERDLWEDTLNVLPEVLLENYVGNTNKYLISVTASGDISDPEFMADLRYDLSTLTPYVSGMPILMDELIDMVISDTIVVSGIAAFVILIVLVLTLRSIKYALINMVPIVGTIYFLVGVLPLFNMKLTIIGLMAVPLVIGIGVAGAVHITKRFQSTGNIPDTLVHTGKAVILSSITTLVGFGSLGFAGHPSLSDLGQIVVLGLGISLLLNVTLLPAILGLIKKSQTIYDDKK